MSDKHKKKAAEADLLVAHGITLNGETSFVSTGEKSKDVLQRMWSGVAGARAACDNDGAFGEVCLLSQCIGELKQLVDLV